MILKRDGEKLEPVMAGGTEEGFIARLEKHLPPRGEFPMTDKWSAFLGGQQPDDGHAMVRFILISFQGPTGYIDAWNPKKERAKLDDFIKTARKLAQLYESLPVDIIEKMDKASEEASEKINQNLFKRLRKLLERHPKYKWDHDRPTDLNSIFYFLGNDEYMNECADAGYTEIEAGRRLGRRNWQAVCLVDSCRVIWHRRTGSEAPINVNPDSPFGRFVADVIDGLGLTDDLRSTLQSWTEVHSKGENI
jgi:hypothetical protein